MTIEVLGAEVSAADVDALTDVLIDAVDGGASVSFLPPLDRETARAWWLKVLAGRSPRGAVIVARDDGAVICGVVMLVPAWAPNQQHHAEVSKLLVHARARRRGHARNLLAALESAARANGFSLLTLDTETDSDAYRLYEAEGWTRAGSIPRFAVDGAGAWVETTYFYKFVD